MNLTHENGRPRAVRPEVQIPIGLTKLTAQSMPTFAGTVMAGTLHLGASLIRRAAVTGRTTVLAGPFLFDAATVTSE